MKSRKRFTQVEKILQMVRFLWFAVATGFFCMLAASFEADETIHIRRLWIYLGTLFFVAFFGVLVPWIMAVNISAGDE